MLCETRRARRHCPGIHADICARCCGEQREVTIVCPFDCEYLREARLREHLPEIRESDFPDLDIPVTDRFVAENGELLTAVAGALFASTEQNPDINDNDVGEALASLVRTYRTRQSGLYYESRPANPLALFVYGQAQQSVDTLNEAMRQQGRGGIRDASVLGALVFLRRVEVQHNNGRRKSRSFLDFIRQNLKLRETLETPPDSPVIVP